MKQPNSEVFEHNKRALESMVSFLDALLAAGAIIGRTDSDIFVHADKMPSMIKDDLDFVHISLEATPLGFMRLFDCMIADDLCIIGILGMSLGEYPAHELRMNDEWPFIEEARAALMALPVLPADQAETYRQKREEKQDFFSNLMTVHREEILDTIFSGNAAGKPVPPKQIH